jgi:fibro-slime domain-containing protein
MQLRFVLAAASVSVLAACGARTELPAPDGDLGGGGAETGGGGAATTAGTGGGGARPSCDPVDVPSMTGRVRDLSAAHPDFEEPLLGDDRGIVQGALGDDGEPIYAGVDGNPTTHGADAFFAWYHDERGVNLGAPFTLPLVPINGGAGYSNDAFFPIDGQLLGDEGNPHNYHFTVELHVAFERTGGERLTFSGDDDLFVFVDGRLALDLGGVHSTESGVVEVDALADALGLETGQPYALDLFFAERHTTGSTFELFLSDFQLCRPPG